MNAIDQKRFYSNRQTGNKLPALLKLQLRIEYSAKHTKERSVPALVDTKAQCNYINARVVETHGLSKFVRTKRSKEIYSVKGFNGKSVLITKSITLRVSIGQRTFHWSFEVTPNLTNQAILGVSALIELGIIHVVQKLLDMEFAIPSKH